MRILITGSRSWTNELAIRRALSTAAAGLNPSDITIVHGACPHGADRIADHVATSAGAAIERHPADWNRHGKRAGFLRNAHMVNLGADICLAFIRDNSRGATHTAALAEKAGIPVKRWTA